jgi:hypothetical protein
MNWIKSHWVCEHEYIFRDKCPELAKEIEESKLVEIYHGKYYPIIYRDGYKYWVMEDIINRKKELPKDNIYPTYSRL